MAKRRAWRDKLYEKDWAVEIWHRKDDPRARVRWLLERLEVPARLVNFDVKHPERALERIAKRYDLHLYDIVRRKPPSVYGFILSKEELSAREVRHIEWEVFVEPFEGE